MFVVAVKAGPTLTTATTAGVGVEVEARGVTVTIEAEVTPGGPGGSPTVRALPAPVGTWFVRGTLQDEKAQPAQDRNTSFSS